MCGRDLLRAFRRARGKQTCGSQCRRCGAQGAGAYAAGEFQTPMGVSYGQQRVSSVLPGRAGRPLQSARRCVARHPPGARDPCNCPDHLGSGHANRARATCAAGDVDRSAQAVFPNLSSPQPPVGLICRAQAAPCARGRAPHTPGPTRRGRFSLVLIAGAVYWRRGRFSLVPIGSNSRCGLAASSIEPFLPAPEIP